MKATASVFAVSTVKKERILLILWRWKYKTLRNWFTCISTERDSSKNTPRLRTDSDNLISVLKNHTYIYWVHSEGHIWQKILNSTCRFVSDSVQYTHYFDHQPDGQYERTRRYNILCNRGSSRTMYCPVPERKQIKWRAKQLSQVACVSEDLKPCWWLWDIPCGTKPSRTSYHRSPGGEV